MKLRMECTLAVTILCIMAVISVCCGCAETEGIMQVSPGSTGTEYGFAALDEAGEIMCGVLENMKKPLPKEQFAKVKEYIPDIVIDLRYATQDNFTGEIIYDFEDAYLRYGTVEKLKHVQEEAARQGYLLKIWDAFRPVRAQFQLWEICPVPKYVASPYGGYSSHSKGNTVDLTLINKDGSEVEMPTGFDDFSDQADRDYSDCPAEAAENARYLEELMQKNGFIPYQGEWWHFEDADGYPVEESFSP